LKIPALKNFRNPGQGALSSRMRSMWDSIETHCWPVDRMAQRVLSFAPWMPPDGEVDAVEEEGAALSIDEVVDVTRPPPPPCKDNRGMRSKYHVIIGFAHRRSRVRNRKVIRNSTPQKDRLRLHGAKRPVIDRITTWYVLRADGCVVLCNSKGLASSLRNLDADFAGELSNEETADFYRWVMAGGARGTKT
jgi:hypothetical protein